MKLAGDNRLWLSPTDLANHLACPHVTQLELRAVAGEIRRPHWSDPHQQLIASKGDEHEAAFLQRLRDDGRHITEIELGEGMDDAARRTETALRAGADVVYQGTFASGGWRGRADFLVRVDTPSGLGPFSYEAWDTKLARSAKPSAVLQLCFYSQELARIQGLLPHRMHVVLGTSAVESYDPREFGAYYRHARRRLARAVDRRPPTRPYPVDHCRICSWSPVCNREWDELDHLVRVANVRRGQIETLATHGITTLEQLGELPPGTRLEGLSAPTLETLRHQASLQLEHRRTGVHRYDLLPPQERRGLGLLPEPSHGDLFFDIEGDPWWEPGRGLEYLFGVMDARGAFAALWAHDRAEEQAMLERFLDEVAAARGRDPRLHVYHYGSYEPSTLKRLVAEYATREDALDDLLRGEVFVDLYTVVRQSLRISYPRTSIKDVRRFFMEATTEVAGGDDATIRYEQWLGDRDEAHLEAIREYNEEDCVSTLRLREWLLERKAEAEARFGVEIPWRPPPEPREVKEETAEELAARERLRQELLARGEPLAGNLLEYHRREAKPVWWAFFNRCEQTPEDLVDDPESIGLLEADGSEPEPVTKQSDAVGFRFPVQQHKLSVGDDAHDPETRKGAGEIVELDSVAGTLRLKRVRTKPVPRALIPGGPYDTREQRRALERVGRSILDGTRRYPHLERVLRREPPLDGRRVQRSSLDEMQALVDEVAGSYLFVQGPPGAGKTYTGARLVVHLLASGRRVGVTATSHKAIHNLLAAIEEAALEAGVSYVGRKKCGDDAESEYEDRFVTSTDDYGKLREDEVQLVAGTAWVFARTEFDGRFDHLFVDEAGQVSLADALAVGTAARTLVLLGDPVQLAQVTQGVHPAGSGASVLEHLLDGAQTVPEDRGLFLERSWRMHPSVCEYVSRAFYEGRLESAAGCERQACTGGTGIRWLPVEHAGRSTESPEEAEAVAAEVEVVVAGTWTDADGVERPLRRADVMVVAPYNAQVKLLQERLPGVRVGTVDKFQGQQAPVVFFSMATSSGADAPRGIDFLMSRNRLNVAISRAQCRAYLVCSPSLLDVDARTIEHMRLANALCAFVERRGG